MDPNFPRAREHFDDLHVALAAFQKLKPYGVRKQRYPKRGYYIYRLKLKRTPPPRLSMIVGDLIHNLRSALDNLMWELCGRPRDPTSRLAFPIFVDEPRNGFSKKAEFSQLSDKAFLIIKSLQPYNGSNSADLQGALRYINLLSNSNKHRAPQIGIILPMGGSYYIPGGGADLDAYDLVHRRAPLDDGSEIARLTFPPGDPPEAHVNFSFDVAFHERAREGDEWSISWRNLRWFYNAVCSIVFERLGPERRLPFTTQSVPSDLVLKS
jgi:hypothetical protein